MQEKKTRFWEINIPIQLSLVFVLILTLGTITPNTAQAQAESITISIALPALEAEALVDSGLITEFEESHPNIEINIIYGEMIAPNITSTAEARQYVQTADVLYIQSSSLNSEITLGGYFLDLAPLTSVDNELMSDDFYQAVWQSFQWNAGVWAIPINFNLSALGYNLSAFDNAGLSYPDGNWTIDEFAIAVRSLAMRDGAGNVINGGLALSGSSEQWVLRSLLGENLFDETVYPNLPRLNTPPVSDLAQTWASLYQEGVITAEFNTDGETPMKISSLIDIVGNPDWRVSFLPNNQVGMNVNGLAISGGTDYPQEAYIFVSFISQNSDALGADPWYKIPARMSSVERLGIFDSLDPEFRDLFLRAIPAAIPLNNLRYFDYLIRAIGQLTENQEASDVLQIAENQARQNQELILQERDSVSLSVVALSSPTQPPDGQISLDFGIQSFISPLPNEVVWDAVIEDFVNRDPEIGQINLEVLVNPTDYSERFDCFYAPYGIGLIETNQVLSLDALMASDSDFNSDDFLNGALVPLTQNGFIWGYPLTLQIEVLNLENRAFYEAGVPLPAYNWSSSEFTDALDALKANTGVNPVFGTIRLVSTDLLRLIAAYDGLPIDYRNNPPLPNFVDTHNVEAIRRVLDLAKQGYIQYIPRPRLGEIPSIDYITAPIMTGSRDIFSSDQFSPENITQVQYPHGVEYTPIGLGVGALYISNQTENPEACYRWIRTIVATPALISHGMPARRSVINSSELLITQGSQNIDLYNAIDSQLQLSNAVIMPSIWVGSFSLEAGPLEYWLYQAFDTYMLDGDLEQSLEDAQVKADAYMSCIANRSIDGSTADFATLAQFYEECAANVDPNYGS